MTEPAYNPTVQQELSTTESQGAFPLLLDAVATPVFIINSGARVVDLNHAAANLSNSTVGALRGKQLDEIATLEIDESGVADPWRSGLIRIHRGAVDKLFSVSCRDIVHDKQSHKVVTIHRDQVNPRASLLGHLAHHVVHEINQPLSVIRMAVGTAKRKLEQGDVEPGYVIDRLDRIDANCCKASEVAETLRIFVPREGENIEPTEVAQIVSGAKTLMAPEFLRNNVALETDLPVTALVAAGEFQVESVVVCLLAMLLGRFRASERVGAQWVRIASSEAADSRVEITLEDSAGATTKEALLEHFISENSGILGAGLDYCHAMVAELDGAIEFHGTSEGARITVVLKKYTQPSAKN